MTVQIWCMQIWCMQTTLDTLTFVMSIGTGSPATPPLAFNIGLSVRCRCRVVWFRGTQSYRKEWRKALLLEEMLRKAPEAVRTHGPLRNLCLSELHENISGRDAHDHFVQLVMRGGRGGVRYTCVVCFLVELG